MLYELNIITAALNGQVVCSQRLPWRRAVTKTQRRQFLASRGLRVALTCASAANGLPVPHQSRAYISFSPGLHKEAKRKAEFAQRQGQSNEHSALRAKGGFAAQCGVKGNQLQRRIRFKIKTVYRAKFPGRTALGVGQESSSAQVLSRRAAVVLEVLNT